MEKQRNPGVGYWSSAIHTNGAAPPGASAGSIAGAGAGPSGMGSRSQSMSGDATPLSEPSRKSMESARTDRTGGTAGGGSAVSASKAPANEEEEVNLEVCLRFFWPSPFVSSASLRGATRGWADVQYLRNVIIQFLENPHMRRQLVQVLSVILHFTPQELRRLNSKLTA